MPCRRCPPAPNSVECMPGTGQGAPRCPGFRQTRLAVDAGLPRMRHAGQTVPGEPGSYDNGQGRGTPGTPASVRAIFGAAPQGFTPGGSRPGSAARARR